MAEASSFHDPVVDAEVIDSSVIDEGNLRRLLRKAGRGVARPALEVLELLMDPATPPKARLTLLAALTYLVMPADLVPDFLPIAGFSDDLVALTAVTVYGDITSPMTFVCGHSANWIGGFPPVSPDRFHR